MNKDPKIVDDFRKNKYPEEQIKGFIKKYPEKLNKDFWWYISYYQTLSEPFIRDFKDYVDWKLISAFQNLSEPFLIELIKDIELGDESHWGLIDNEKIPEDVKKRIIDLKKVIDQ